MSPSHHTFDCEVSCEECFIAGHGFIHIKFPLTKEGRGPATGDDFDHYGCWCCDPKCYKWREAAL